MNKLPIFEHTKCNLCGKCVAACNRRIISISSGRIILTGDNCMQCTHCYAVCGPGAVSFGPDMRDPSFLSIKPQAKSNKAVILKPEALIDFLRSRRSIRRYKDKPVSEAILHDLVETAVTAPSGSNCQNWEFTVVTGREKVYGLALEIGKFFEKINRLAGNAFIRRASILFAGRLLINYYRDRYQSVEMGLAEAKKGNDILFHGAAALIIVHGTLEGSMPRIDAQYAAYNIALAAHSMGLGSCFIGYASESIRRSKRLKKYLEIPAEHDIHAVIALGYPDIKFFRPALRREYNINFI